jgi:hypothetical protein
MAVNPSIVVGPRKRTPEVEKLLELRLAMNSAYHTWGLLKDDVDTFADRGEGVEGALARRTLAYMAQEKY